MTFTGRGMVILTGKHANVNSEGEAVSRKLSDDKEIALRQMAGEMASGSIVTQALSRYLFQILEFMYDEYIEPKDKRIKELEHKLKVLGGKL